MQIDRKFFEKIVQMLETNHMLVYSNQHELGVTEAWVSHVNATLRQCKEINEVEKYQEEAQALCTYWQQMDNSEIGGDQAYHMALEKTIDLVSLEDEIGHDDMIY